MPSICTHLLIAEDALEALPPGPDRSLLESQRELYFLGALAPDLPYFNIFAHYRGLPLGAVLSTVSHTLESKMLAWLGWAMPEQDGWAGRFHGLGTLKLLRSWLAWARPRHPGLSVLLLGMLTHLAADEVLHPKVNADSGGTEDAEAMRRHRELEINLDLTLLRSRGVAVESMDYSGLVELYLGSVDRRGEYMSPGLKHAWIQASLSGGQGEALSRAELDQWSRGFAGAMRLLGHALSPMQQQKRVFLNKGEEKWRTFFARERYLSAHVPRASRAAQALLRGSADSSLVGLAG
jgi:hypothetical protein